MPAKKLDLAVDGARLHVVTATLGKRSWITLLHALGADHRMWEPQAAALRSRYNVLSFDMRGHGASTVSENGYALSRLGTDVVEIWDQLGIERSHLAGVSLGGMIALGLGLDHPARIGGIVAAGCRADAPPAFQAMWAERRDLLSHSGISALADATLAAWFPHPVAAGLASLARAMIEGISPAAYVGISTALQSLALRARLETMTRPVLLICGSADGPYPETMLEMADLMPDSALLLLERMGHLSNLEDTAGFDLALHTFLEKVD